MELYELLAIFLKERGFSVSEWPEIGGLEAHRNHPDSSVARWVIFIEDDSRPSPTRKFITVTDQYPKLDEGDMTAVGHNEVLIEFADPTSFEVLEELLNREKLDPVNYQP